jgi:hypothetical protein
MKNNSIFTSFVCLKVVYGQIRANLPLWFTSHPLVDMTALKHSAHYRLQLKLSPSQLLGCNLRVAITVSLQLPRDTCSGCLRIFLITEFLPYLAKPTLLLD